MSIGILFSGFIAFLVMMATMLFLFAQKSRQSELLDEVARQSRENFHSPDERIVRGRETGFSTVSFLRGLISRQPDPNTVRRLSQAGYRLPMHVDLFTASKLILPALLAFAVILLVSVNTAFFFFMAVLVGFMTPDFWLSNAISRRDDRIATTLPDGLDLISICMDAGLGLDQAIVRVGQELKSTHPDLSQEFLQINFEQRAGVPRLDSWRAFADRVPVESLRSFVGMLVQTERFGTPIAQALATFSEGLRTESRQRAEELGARAAIKLVFPMVLFIFPMVFVVTVGPAVLGLIKNFSQLLQ